MQPWVTSLEYILKYTQRGYFTSAAKFISDHLSPILLRSFKFTNFILQEESRYSFQSKREKRVLYPLQKMSIYRIILYLARIKTKSCNFLSAHEQIATKIMGRQHVHCNVSKEITSSDSPVIQLSSRER